MPPREAAIRMAVHREALAGVEQLDEQRRVGPVAAHVRRVRGRPRDRPRSRRGAVRPSASRVSPRSSSPKIVVVEPTQSSGRTVVGRGDAAEPRDRARRPGRSGGAGWHSGGSASRTQLPRLALDQPRRQDDALRRALVSRRAVSRSSSAALRPSSSASYGDHRGRRRERLRELEVVEADERCPGALPPKHADRADRDPVVGREDRGRRIRERQERRAPRPPRRRRRGPRAAPATDRSGCPAAAKRVAVAVQALGAQ